MMQSIGVENPIELMKKDKLDNDNASASYDQVEVFLHAFSNLTLSFLEILLSGISPIS